MTSPNEAIIESLVEQLESIKQDYPFDYSKIKAEVNEETKIQEFRLIEDAATNTTKHHYYNTILIECKRIFAQLSTLEEILHSKLWEYFKYESDKRLKNSEDYRRNIVSHPAWIKLQGFKKQVEIDISYLHHVDKCFSERSFNLQLVAKLLQG